MYSLSFRIKEKKLKLKNKKKSVLELGIVIGLTIQGLACKALVKCKGTDFSHLKIIVQIRTNNIASLIGKTIKGTLMYTFDHRRHM